MNNWKKFDPLQVLGWSVVAGAIYLWMPAMSADERAYVQAEQPGSGGISFGTGHGPENLTSASEKAKPNS